MNRSIQSTHARIVCSMFLAGGLTWPSFGVWAGAQEPTAAEIQRLIAQLGNDNFAMRQAAHKRLEAIGEPAVPALEQAATTSKDVEVRRRAEQIIRAIYTPQFAKAAQVRRIAWQDTVQNIPAHIYHTAFSPDSRTYLAGGDVGPLRLWDVAGGQQLQELKGHEGWSCGAVFTSDGKQVLSGGLQDKLLRLWDVTSGKEIRTFTGHTEALTSVAVSPDNRLALSGSADKTLRLWRLATAEEVHRLEGHTDKCAGLFSPDGKRVLSFSADKTLRLWDVGTGKLLRVLQGHAGEIGGAFVLPGGRQVGSYSYDKTLRIWDLATGKEERRLDLGDHCLIRWLAITPDGKRFVMNQQDCTVRLRDLATGRELHRFAIPRQASPQGISVSPDDKYVADGSFRGFVHLFRLRD